MACITAASDNSTYMGAMSTVVISIFSAIDKADALKATICGPITPQVPASILQLHNDVTIVADEAALSKMDI